MEPQQTSAQPAQALATPATCPRCQGHELRRHKDTASHDIGLYNCRCGWIFKSPNPPQQPENAGPEDEDDYFTNFTEVSYEKTRNSYDPSEVAAKKQTFLVAYQFGLTVEQAAQLAGVSARAAYYWRDKDHDFAQAWRNSRDRFVEALEMLAFQRAAKGSDRMLSFLLKSHRPDIYNERIRRNNANSGTQDPDRTFSLVEIFEKIRRWEVDDKWEVMDPPQDSVLPDVSAQFAESAQLADSSQSTESAPTPAPPPPHESLAPQGEV